MTLRERVLLALVIVLVTLFTGLVVGLVTGPIFHQPAPTRPPVPSTTLPTVPPTG